MAVEDLSQQIAELRELIVTRTNPPEVLKPHEAAEMIGVAVETLQRWRKDGWGPKYSQPNERIVRYMREDVLEFLREYRR